MPNDRPLDELQHTSLDATSSRRAAAPQDVDAAIGRVLAAEAAARENTALAIEQAAAIDDASRRRVREIGERAERRVRAGRASYEAAVAREVARLDAEAAAQQQVRSLDDADRARILDAVAAVARELTS